MPYGKRTKSTGEIEVINTDTGHVFGTHSSEAGANSQLAALHANVKDIESATDKVVKSIHNKSKSR